MKLELGVCLAPEAAAALPSHPYAFLEGNVQSQLVPEQDDGVWAGKLAAMRAGPRPTVAANCFIPGNLKVVGPQVEEARLERWALVACARAQQAGITTIVFGSGGARSVPEGWTVDRALAQATDFLRMVGPIAARHGVTVVVESLNRAECNFLNTLAEAAVVVRGARHPAIRLLVDVYHMMRDGEPPSAMREVGDLVHHAHIAEKEARTVPGVAGDDLRPYLAALRATGFSGRIALEALFKAQPPEVELGVATLDRQAREVGWTILGPR
jgi:sugar phosphate isomerase/epimerase